MVSLNLSYWTRGGYKSFGQEGQFMSYKRTNRSSKLPPFYLPYTHPWHWINIEDRARGILKLLQYYPKLPML